MCLLGPFFGAVYTAGIKSTSCYACCLFHQRSKRKRKKKRADRLGVKEGVFAEARRCRKVLLETELRREMMDGAELQAGEREKSVIEKKVGVGGVYMEVAHHFIPLFQEVMELVMLLMA